MVVPHRRNRPFGPGALAALLALAPGGPRADEPPPPAANMRRCLLLPVIDKREDGDVFGVFQGLEEHLREGGWCLYRSNSEILDILQGFRAGLAENLRDKEVLGLVARKTGAGSLVRVSVEGTVEGSRVEVAVVGENGEDAYFRESTDIATREPSAILRTAKNHLDAYGRQLPYDALVTEVLGDRFTIDLGRSLGPMRGDLVRVRRPGRRRRHPLLGDVVGWESAEVATGRITHASTGRSQGRVTEYAAGAKVRTGDWASITRGPSSVDRSVAQAPAPSPDAPPPADDGASFSAEPMDPPPPGGRDAHRFGKLGRLRMATSAGSGSTRSDGEGRGPKRIGGPVLGADVDAELWITRHVFASLGIGKTFGDQKWQAGQRTWEGTHSLNETSLRILAGYRFLPLGFFHGPQVKVYGGHTRLRHGLDTTREDGFTEFRFGGLLFGITGRMPLMPRVQASLDAGFSFRPAFEEDAGLHGGDGLTTAHSYATLAGEYSLSPVVALRGEAGMSDWEAMFRSPVGGVRIRRTTFRLGAVYTF